MSDTSIRTKIGEALAKINDLKGATDADFPTKLVSARQAADAVAGQLIELPAPPAILATYTCAFLQKKKHVLEEPPAKPEEYNESEMKSVRNGCDELRDELTRIDAILAGVDGEVRTQPLLSSTVRRNMLVTAALLVVIGAVLAIFGSAQKLTTLSYWCAFAASVAAIIPLFDNLNTRKPGGFLQFRAMDGNTLQYAVFGGIAFLVLAMLAVGMFTGTLLEFLQTIPGARGLITFLIAIGTIAIAVILALASVIIDTNSNEKAEELKERLSKGKEILTVLVGVLGTIVGFYFANSSDATGRLAVSVTQAQSSVKQGDTIVVKAVATGGELPYEPPLINVGKGVRSDASIDEKGVITVTLTLDRDAPPGPFSLIVGVRDKLGKTTSSKPQVIEVIPLQKK